MPSSASARTSLRLHSFPTRRSSDLVALCQDGLLAFGIAPGTDGVEVLEREPDGIHAVVAGGAHRIFPVHLEHVAQRGLVFLEIAFADRKSTRLNSSH